MRVFIENISQARRELAKVYRDYKTDKINSDNARTKVHILRAVIESCFKYEIEKRLEEIEKKVGI
ncbi:MAG: hypothetical protein R6W68_11405 [Ignavibacteriaceae bacterium]